MARITTFIPHRPGEIIATCRATIKLEEQKNVLVQKLAGKQALLKSVSQPSRAALAYGLSSSDEGKAWKSKRAYIPSSKHHTCFSSRQLRQENPEKFRQLRVLQSSQTSPPRTLSAIRTRPTNATSNYAN